MARDRVARLVHRLADPAGYDRATDRELLGWFAEARDERAFEVLVRRHGRLVWSAAARVLADPNDIDDAVQATFLVLVRRAGRSDWRADAGPWLYGVAHRVAVRLRARSRGMKPWASADGAWQFSISNCVSAAASCASCGARRSPNPALLITSPTSMPAVNARPLPTRIATRVERSAASASNDSRTAWMRVGSKRLSGGRSSVHQMVSPAR